MLTWSSRVRIGGGLGVGVGGWGWGGGGSPPPSSPVYSFVTPNPSSLIPAVLLTLPVIFHNSNPGHGYEHMGSDINTDTTTDIEYRATDKDTDRGTDTNTDTFMNMCNDMPWTRTHSGANWGAPPNFFIRFIDSMFNMCTCISSFSTF